MVAIIVILSLLGLVWTAVFLQRGSLLAGCLAFLLIGYCFGRDLLGFRIGPLPMTIDRLVLGSLLIAYVVKRRLGQMDPKPITWVETAVLALAGALTVSTFTHNWRLDVPGKVSPIWLLVASYLMPLAVFWMVRQVRLTRRSVTCGCSARTASACSQVARRAPRLAPRPTCASVPGGATGIRSGRSPGAAWPRAGGPPAGTGRCGSSPHRQRRSRCPA